MATKTKKTDGTSGGEQPLIEHLLELRTRLLRIVLGVLLCLIPLLPFAQQIFATLAAPLLPIEKEWFSGALVPHRPGFASLRYRTVGRRRLLAHAEHDPRLCRRSQWDSDFLAPESGSTPA